MEGDKTTEDRKQWNAIYLLIFCVVVMGICGGLSQWVRETTGSRLAILISPVAGIILLAFIIVYRDRFKT